MPKVAFLKTEASFLFQNIRLHAAADILNHVLDNYYFAGDSTFEITLELQEAKSCDSG